MGQHQKMAHYILTNFLFPKINCTSSATNFEQCFIYHMLNYQPINMPVFIIGGFQWSTGTLRLGSIITRILKDHKVSLVEEIHTWGTEITAAALFGLVYDQPIVPKKGKWAAIQDTEGMVTRKGKKDRKRKAVQSPSKEAESPPKKIKFVSRGTKPQVQQGQVGPKSAKERPRQVEPEEEKEDTPEQPLQKKKKISSRLSLIDVAPLGVVISEDSHFTRSRGIVHENNPTDQDEDELGGQFDNEETVDDEQHEPEQVEEEEAKKTANDPTDQGAPSPTDSIESIPADPSPQKTRRLRRLKKKANKSPVIDLMDDSPLRDPITDLSAMQFKFFSNPTESPPEQQEKQASVSNPKEHADSTAPQNQVNSEEVLEVPAPQHGELAKEIPAQVSAKTPQPPKSSQLQPDSEQVTNSTDHPLPQIQVQNIIQSASTGNLNSRPVADHAGTSKIEPNQTPPPSGSTHTPATGPNNDGSFSYLNASESGRRIIDSAQALLQDLHQTNADAAWVSSC
ncbi:pollen-specific leucine-rich repeat extensin-like protein 1 isoform X1 [Euphorbia lathyris]|uniref:pollen-specific leucine-rich repeat extensin-like protein 1 isoform X1 n=1 Tax=Euphorbia lathyris TaxID=212925 RepID=UPI003313D634